MEELYPIIGYEELYAITKTGKLWAFPKTTTHNHKNPGHWINWRLDGCGYPFTSLTKDGVIKQPKLHRLLAEQFIPNPENLPQINHKNGIKTDFSLDNLEWCTASDNIKHAFKTGLKHQNGEANHRAKLSEKDIESIKVMSKEGTKQFKIAEKFNVSRSAICNILKNKRWKHI